MNQDMNPAARGQRATGSVGHQIDGSRAKVSSIDGRSKTADSLTDYQRRMMEFHAQAREGGGMFRCEVIRQQHALHAIMSGYGWLPMCMAQWMHLVKTDDKPPLCLACDFEFTVPDKYPPAFVITRTLFRQSRVVMTAVCRRCAKKSDERLLDIAFRHFKQMGMAKDKLSVSEES